MPDIRLAHTQVGAGNGDLGGIQRIVDPRHTSLFDRRAVMDRPFCVGRIPAEGIWPATWAPTSITSSGSIVPVATIVATKLPRVGWSVRKSGSVVRPRYHCQLVVMPAAKTTAMIKKSTSFRDIG